MKCAALLLSLLPLTSTITPGRAADQSLRGFVCVGVDEAGDRLGFTGLYETTPTGGAGPVRLVVRPSIRMLDREGMSPFSDDFLNVDSMRIHAGSTGTTFYLSGDDGSGTSFVVAHQEGTRGGAKFAATMPNAMSNGPHVFSGQGACRFYDQ